MPRRDNKLMTMLSIWGIVLVVLGHSGFEETIIQQNLYVIHSWIYSFHMPLFFMVSGYLFSLTNIDFKSIDYAAFMKKKVIRLLIPYFALGVVLYGIKFIFSRFSHAERVFSVENFFKMFIAPSCEGSTMGYLWYVFTLFVIFFIVVTLCKIGFDFRRVHVCLLGVFVSWACYILLPGTAWLSASAVMRYLPYFVIGIMFQVFESSVPKYMFGGGNLIITIVLSVALCFVEVPSSYVWCLEILRAFVGLVMSVSLCTILLKIPFVEQWILPLGRFSYSIYLLSWFGQYMVKMLVVNLLNLHWLAVVVSMFLAGLAFPVAVCLIVEKVSWLNRQKWLRAIIGY